MQGFCTRCSIAWLRLALSRLGIAQASLALLSLLHRLNSIIVSGNA